MGNVKEYILNQKIKLDDIEFDYHYANTGVPHIIIYLEKENFNIDFVNKYGKEIQKEKIFLKKE